MIRELASVLHCFFYLAFVVAPAHTCSRIIDELSPVNYPVPASPLRPSKVNTLVPSPTDRPPSMPPYASRTPTTTAGLLEARKKLFKRRGWWGCETSVRHLISSLPVLHHASFTLSPPGIPECYRLNFSVTSLPVSLTGAY